MIKKTYIGILITIIGLGLMMIISGPSILLFKHRICKYTTFLCEQSVKTDNENDGLFSMLDPSARDSFRPHNEINTNQNTIHEKGIDILFQGSIENLSYRSMTSDTSGHNIFHVPLKPDALWEFEICGTWSCNHISLDYKALSQNPCVHVIAQNIPMTGHESCYQIDMRLYPSTTLYYQIK